jgi:hypothetical protein
MSLFKEIRTPDHRQASSTARRAGRRRALALAVPKGRAGLRPRAISPGAPYKSIAYEIARSRVPPRVNWFARALFHRPPVSLTRRGISVPVAASIRTPDGQGADGRPLHPPRVPLDAQTAPSAPGGSRSKKLTTNIPHPDKTPLPRVAHSKAPCAPPATNLSK